MHAWGSTTPPGRDALALAHAAILPYGLVTPSAPGLHDFGAHNFGIPCLHIPLPNASRASLRPPSHGSGPGWFATPFLYDSFIHSSTPVYPDAIKP